MNKGHSISRVTFPGIPWYEISAFYGNNNKKGPYKLLKLLTLDISMARFDVDLSIRFISHKNFIKRWVLLLWKLWDALELLTCFQDSKLVSLLSNFEQVKLWKVKRKLRKPDRIVRKLLTPENSLQVLKKCFIFNFFLNLFKVRSFIKFKWVKFTLNI